MKKILIIFNLIIMSFLLIACVGDVVEKSRYTVTFDTKGGTFINAMLINEGDLIEKPADPIKDKHTFLYWTLNEIEYDFNLEVTTDLYLEAKWIEEFTIIFESEGTPVLEQVILDGNKALEPITPLREGYIFDGWLKDEEQYDFNQEVVSDFVLEASWKKEFIVTFNSKGGSLIESQTVVSNGQVMKPEDPVRENYEFLYWMLNNQEFDFEMEVKSNLELEAFWHSLSETKSEFKVSFDTLGGGLIAPQTVLLDGLVKDPGVARKTGHEFLYWEFEGRAFNFDTFKVTKDLTLNAVYGEYIDKPYVYNDEIETDFSSDVVIYVVKGSSTVNIGDKSLSEYITIDGNKIIVSRDYLSELFNGDRENYYFSIIFANPNNGIYIKMINISRK